VEFYINEHNTKMPYPAFAGQMPDEMSFGTRGVREIIAEVMRQCGLAVVIVEHSAEARSTAESSRLRHGRGLFLEAIASGLAGATCAPTARIFPPGSGWRGGTISP
jgi:hypothetical protein